MKEVVQQCTCEDSFPVEKIADGKYKIGENRVLIFVRVMRNHVMVRVGGGWDTLENYIQKHDPCRSGGSCNSCFKIYRFLNSYFKFLNIGRNKIASSLVDIYYACILAGVFKRYTVADGRQFGGFGGQVVSALAFHL